jgi:hypothetical protein
VGLLERGCVCKNCHLNVRSAVVWSASPVAWSSPRATRALVHGLRLLAKGGLLAGLHLVSGIKGAKRKTKNASGVARECGQGVRHQNTCLVKTLSNYI